MEEHELIMQLGGFEQVVKFFDKTQERGGVRMLEREHNLICYKKAKRKIKPLRTCNAHAEVERLTQELQNYTRKGERYENFFRERGLRRPRNNCSLESFLQMSHQDLAHRAWSIRDQTKAIATELLNEFDHQREHVQRLQTEREAFTQMLRLRETRLTQLSLNHAADIRIMVQQVYSAPSTVSSVQIHANAILEAAKASVTKQMRQARASDSPET
ncbi:hypothetical protein E4T38_00810 [Aureobasidium subglaciale]|nr:hypothetical protein E4T38_00810 [Aureobasidium subglaciale]KAI5231120.1 hypothetical protein E4T40_00811 [Aureobasidium subglaciale]KAI5234097.1 hypothetical protein E4T41_00809 [Aureobasidium subglaciale]KAI5267511.1 hypothetical protein E4T46_00809 [Aureobasidium subglaciale]